MLCSCWRGRRGTANQRVEAIIIGFDFDKIDQPIVRDPSELQRREHPAASGETMTAFLYSYLGPSFKHLALAAYGNFFRSVTWYRYDPEQGKDAFPFTAPAWKRTPQGISRAGFRLFRKSAATRPAPNKCRNCVKLSSLRAGTA